MAERRRGLGTTAGAALALALCAPLHAAASPLLAVTPELRRCVVSSAEDGAASRTCSRKLLALLSIPPTESTGATLEAAVNCVKACRCPDATRSEDGPIAATLPPDENGACPCAGAEPACVPLAAPLRIKVRKSPVVATYPLRYVRAFNDGPVEHVTLTGGTTEAARCNDNAASDHPTCGWFHEQDTGQRVLDSQGFCCECTARQGWEHTWSGSSEQTRANLNCGFFQQGLYAGGVPGSAHCLWYSELWYQGYQVEAPFVRFTVDVDVTMPDLRNATLVLAPSDPVQRLQDGTVEARLKGDLAGYRSLPNLQGRFAMVPFPKGQAPSAVLGAGTANWMILEAYQVSLDGTACDRVGTSFTAFRYHPGACDRPVGACLGNQLKDLREQDVERVRNGLAPTHSLARYGASGATASLNQNSEGMGNERIELGVAVPDAAESLVTLMLDADDLTYVVNRAPGRIVDASVAGFGHTSSAVPAGVFYFESMAGDGYLSVVVQNTGSILADFLVSAPRCTVGVLHGSLLARFVSVAAGATELLGGSGDDGWRLRMATSAAGLHNCTVQLRDSLGVVVDEKVVVFGTNATRFDAAPVLQEGRQAATGPNTREAPPSCTAMCPRLYDIPCHVVHGCWTRFFIFLALMAACAAAVALAYRMAVRTPGCLCGYAWRSAAYLTSKGERQAATLPTHAPPPQPEPSPQRASGAPRASPQSVKGGCSATNNEVKFLHLMGGTPPPFGLQHVGPTFCVAVTCAIAKDAFVEIVLPPGRMHQHVAWDAVRGAHVALPSPAVLRAEKLVVPSRKALVALRSMPRCACLN